MSVLVAESGHIAVVEINRPPNNHVSVELIAEIADVLERLDGVSSCRVVVLCSEGKNFCAGADLAAGQGAPPQTSALYEQAARLFSTKKPNVAAVQGAAVGAGLGLALVAVFRVAGEDARFVANFTKLGFHPGFGLTHPLPRLIGKQRASLMFLTGRRVRAEEAVIWGLVDQVATDPRAAAIILAEEIAENAPLAVQSTRATLRGELAAAVKAQTDHEHTEQTWLRQTADYAEGVRAVSERRPGVFHGR